MEQQTTIRITRSVSSVKNSNHGKDFSTQAAILKDSSEREITPKDKNCSEKRNNNCDLAKCDCDYEIKQEYKPDQFKVSRSNLNPSPGYVRSSQSTRFQTPSNTDQNRKYLNSSTQVTVLKNSSERQITPKKRKCTEDGCKDCNPAYCECDYIEVKPDQSRISKSNINPPPGYGIPSQNRGFQVPPNVNQMPFNQARFSCPCPDSQAPGTSPTDDELWDLQFCRWWGWNWIRKREEMINKKQCESAPKKNCSCQIEQSKERSRRKHPRKSRDFFSWFRSPKTRPCLDMEERQRLNDLYDTPSCSTNECICPADDWECRSLDFKGEYSCYCNSAGKATSMSTIIIKNHKCGHVKKSRSVICEKMDSTTSEECCAPCKSSTGESSDCVTLHLKCVKSECRDKIPCECGLKRNRNVCPCKVQLCEKPKHVCCKPVCCRPVCCEPVCCKPVCCEPVCRPRKRKSSPFICLPSRKPPPPCKPIPLLCQNNIQRHPPCCVPKLCKPLPTCRYQFPKYIKRCPEQNVCCVAPKKEYVVCCKKPKVCCTNDKGRCCCCCCCCCCCKNQLKSVDKANKREGTSKAFSGKPSDASDSTKSISSNQHRTHNSTSKKHSNPEKQLSISNSLQSGKYVSPLTGRNYALNPKTITVSPIILKSKLPAPIDTNDEAFNFASVPAGDWEHTELLQAVCDAVMSARSHNEETKTFHDDPFMNWPSTERLSQSIGDSKLIEEKPTFKDPNFSPVKENTFLNSLLDTLDDKYFNNLERNFPKFTPLASLPEEESIDLQCENNSCVLDEATGGSSIGSNSDFKNNTAPGPSAFSPCSLIPFNSPRTWLTEQKLPSASMSGLFSSVSRKPPTKSKPPSRSSSPNKKSNVYDILFSTVEPHFEPSDSKIFSPQSHALLLHEIPRPDVTEQTQTSKFVFNPDQPFENEMSVNIAQDFKSKRSKIPVLVKKENKSPLFNINKNVEYVIKEGEEEKEIASDFLDKKCSSVFGNVQSTAPVFTAPNLIDNGMSFAKINPSMASESSKEIFPSLQSVSSNSSKFSATSPKIFNFSVPKISSGPFLATDASQIPTTSGTAGTSSKKVKYTNLRKKDNFIVGDDVVTAKYMKRESPFSMFCKPVKSSSIVNLLPMSAKRSLLSRPEKRIFLKKPDTLQD